MNDIPWIDEDIPFHDEDIPFYPHPGAAVEGEDLSDVFGLEPIAIIEIDQPLCTRTYGSSPCTASGSEKCFNTRGTCQDPTNYEADILTLRFCQNQAGIDQYDYMIPSVDSINTAPVELNIGSLDRSSKELGKRAVIDISFNDHKHSDLLVDPYRGDRSYNPYERSTFWSKWLARNPYYIGMPLRVREGYIGQALDNMRRRSYLISKIDGPTKGRIKITAKDILKLADDDKAQAPFPSKGVLLATIDNDDMSFDIAGTIEDDYPTGGGKVRIDDEIITYSSAIFDSETDQTTITVSERGSYDTEADDHDENTTVQLCLEFVDAEAWEVIEELLVNYANIPSAYIDSATWQDEWGTYLPQFEISTLISEPEGITKLLGEICQQTLSFIWWDEREEEIRYQAIRTPPGDITQITDNENIIADSIEIKRMTDMRISQTWIYYDRKDPTKKLDEITNYARRRINADLDAEMDEQYGESKRLVIYSRWLNTDAAVITLAARLLNRYRDPPIKVGLRLDAKDGDLWVGDLVDLYTAGIVEETGNVDRMRMQIISAEEISSAQIIKYQMLTFGKALRLGYWMLSEYPVYDNATEAQREVAGFWADDGGLMGDGTMGYAWQ